MTPVRRRHRCALATVLAIAALACAETPGDRAGENPVGSSGGETEASAASLRLAVLISVDGFGEAALVAHQTELRSGLARLVREGRRHRATRYQHLNTETGPGHASLGTGALPCVHGIVANEWFEQDAAGAVRLIYCAGGTAGPSAERMTAETLAMRLAAQRPGAKVVALSGKDRGAILLAGRLPDAAAFWYQRDSGRFASSAAYPGAAEATTAGRIAARFSDGTRALIARSDPGELIWRPAPGPSNTASQELALRPHQLPVVGLGPEHDLRLHSRGAAGGIYHSPLLDRLTIDLALALLADETLALGRDDTPDLLLLSLSAVDTVAHYYGPESRETRDTVLQLDQQLGRLLEALERSIGRARVTLALSADHGMASLPEPAAPSRTEAQRRRFYSAEGSAAPPDAIDQLNALLSEALCLPPDVRPILAARGMNLYFDRARFPLRRSRPAAGVCGRTIERRDLDAALQRLIPRHFGDRIDAVIGLPPAPGIATSPWVPFVRAAFHPARSGDAMLIPKAGTVVFQDPIRGTSHGSPHEYDVHVPWIEWGAGIAPSVVDADDTPYDIAPALAARLGVTLASPEERRRCPDEDPRNQPAIDSVP